MTDIKFCAMCFKGADDGLDIRGIPVGINYSAGHLWLCGEHWNEEMQYRVKCNQAGDGPKRYKITPFRQGKKP